MTNVIFRKEIHLHNIIIGYATHAIRAITIYEYRAPGGLNHGLELLYDEMSTYPPPPPMLEATAELLGDFVTLYEAHNMSQVQIHNIEPHVSRL